MIAISYLLGAIVALVTFCFVMDEFILPFLTSKHGRFVLVWVLICVIWYFGPSKVLVVLSPYLMVLSILSGVVGLFLVSVFVGALTLLLLSLVFRRV